MGVIIRWVVEHPAFTAAVEKIVKEVVVPLIVKAVDKK